MAWAPHGEPEGDAERAPRAGGSPHSWQTVLGLGVNLTAAPHLPGRPIPPACLAELGLTPPEPLTLALHLLKAWSRWDRLPRPAFRWPAPGDALAWEEGQGRCTQWLEDGRLEVQTPQGLLKLSAGDVRGLKG